MPTKLIAQFEQNNNGISINTLYADEDTSDFSIEYVIPHRNCTHHVNILPLSDSYFRLQMADLFIFLVRLY